MHDELNLGIFSLQILVYSFSFLFFFLVIFKWTENLDLTAKPKIISSDVRCSSTQNFVNNVCIYFQWKNLSLSLYLLFYCPVVAYYSMFPLSWKFPFARFCLFAETEKKNWGWAGRNNWKTTVVLKCSGRIFLFFCRRLGWKYSWIILNYKNYSLWYFRFITLS